MGNPNHDEKGRFSEGASVQVFKQGTADPLFKGKVVARKEGDNQYHVRVLNPKTGKVSLHHDSVVEKIPSEDERKGRLKSLVDAHKGKLKGVLDHYDVNEGLINHVKEGRSIDNSEGKALIKKIVDFRNRTGMAGERDVKEATKSIKEEGKDRRSADKQWAKPAFRKAYHKSMNRLAKRMFPKGVRDT